MPSIGSAPRRAVLYCRVERDDAAAERQFEGLRAWCEREGWRVVEEYLDYDTRTGVTRDDFKRLMHDAAYGAFDLVLFTRVGDFVAEGVRETARYLAELNRLGVDYASRDEPALSTMGAHAGTVRAVVDLFATQENRRISARIRAGMLRAKQEGRPIGRPKLDRALRRRIVELRRAGKTLADTAAELGVSVGTVVKYQRRPVDDLLDELMGDRE